MALARIKKGCPKKLYLKKSTVKEKRQIFSEIQKFLKGIISFELIKNILRLFIIVTNGRFSSKYVSPLQKCRKMWNNLTFNDVEHRVAF